MNNILKLSEDGKTIIGVNDKKITHITIPEGVTTIGDCAFWGCSALQCIDIPNSVTTIEYGAFYGCSSLQSIDIPNSVTTIGYGAFRNCSALQCINVSDDNPNYTSADGILFNKELSAIIKLPEGEKIEVYNIPNSVTTIGYGSFWGCSALQCINIPNSVTTIGYGAFWGCSALQNIDIPNSVTTIGDLAFNGCSALQCINIPNSVTKIGDNVFRNCSALQSINVSDDNPNYTSADGILFNKELSTIIKLPEGEKIEVYNIPNSVMTIGGSAFSGCSALQSIDIPNSVTTIGGRVFWGCSALKSIHLHWTKLDCIQIIKYTFGENNKVNFEECTLYVPPGTRWEYRHHSVFGQFKNIEIEKQ